MGQRRRQIPGGNAIPNDRKYTSHPYTHTPTHTRAKSIIQIHREPRDERLANSLARTLVPARRHWDSNSLPKEFSLSLSRPAPNEQPASTAVARESLPPLHFGVYEAVVPGSFNFVTPIQSCKSGPRHY